MNETVLKIAGKMSEKARTDFLAFIRDVDSICGADDDRMFENTDADIRQDDHDGVAVTLAADLEEIHRKEIEKLAGQERESDVEIADDEPSYLIPEPAPVAVLVAPVITVATDINKKGKFGYTPLHQAVINNDIAEVRRLIALGADLSLKDNSLATPRDKALNRGFDDIAAIL